MFNIRYATEDDKTFWFSLDKHISEAELRLKIRDKRGYIINDGDTPIGVMRYNLLWDITPFLTMICLEGSYRRKGFGKQSVRFWENEMAEAGYDLIMTSTQVDEQAQHFYRKLGFKERGGIVLDGTPLDQAQEMFMLKVLQGDQDK